MIGASMKQSMVTSPNNELHEETHDNARDHYEEERALRERELELARHEEEVRLAEEAERQRLAEEAQRQAAREAEFERRKAEAALEQRMQSVATMQRRLAEKAEALQSDAQSVEQHLNTSLEQRFQALSDELNSKLESAALTAHAAAAETEPAEAPERVNCRNYRLFQSRNQHLARNNASGA